MFRPVRKKKNEIDQAAMKSLLKTARHGVLAMNGDDGFPYAIPVNFYYDEEKSAITFHGAKVGHKVDALNRSDKVCFTVCGPEMVREEAWAPFAQSVVVFGRCAMVEDLWETEQLVKQFAMKYYPSEQLADEEIAASLKSVRMFRISIEHMSGKEVQEK